MGKLLEYEFPIIYRLGKQNQTADTLSWPPDGELMAISTRHLDWKTELWVANTSHLELVAIKESITWGHDDKSSYVVRDGLLFFKGRPVIPSDSHLKQ